MESTRVVSDEALLRLVLPRPSDPLLLLPEIFGRASSFIGRSPFIGLRAEPGGATMEVGGLGRAELGPLAPVRSEGTRVRPVVHTQNG